MTIVKRLGRPVIVLLAGVVVLALASCQDSEILQPDRTSATPDGASSLDLAADHALVSLPFKGTLRTTKEVPDLPPPEGCDLAFLTEQAGELTHLGQYTGSGRTCGFNLRVPVANPPFNPAGGPPPYLVADFTIHHVYTAANGDLLEVFGEATLVQSLETGESGFRGIGTIEGGTGRFQDATGWFDVLGVQGEVSYDGQIIFGR